MQYLEQKTQRMCMCNEIFLITMSVSVEWHYFVRICFKTDLLSEFRNIT